MARGDDYLDRREYLTITADNEEHELVLEHAYSVTGFALDDAGAGVDHLPVRLVLQTPDGGEDEDQEVEYARTDAYGAFRFHDIPPGLYQVRASSYGWQLEEATPELVEVPGTTELALTMVPNDRPERFSIRGVVDLQEGGVADRLSIRGLQGGHLEIDGATFLATGLTPTRHRLRVGHPGYGTITVGPIDPLPGQEIDLGQIRLEPATLLTVRVTDKDGKSVDRATVRLDPLPADKGGIGQGASPIRLGSTRRGRYQAHAKAFAWRLVVKHEGHAVYRKRIVVEPQETQSLRAKLQAGK